MFDNSIQTTIQWPNNINKLSTQQRRDLYPRKCWYLYANTNTRIFFSSDFESMLYPIVLQLMQEKYLNSKTDFSVHKQVHFSHVMDWIAYALSVAGDPGSVLQPEAHSYAHQNTTSFSSKKISHIIYWSTDYEFRLTKYIGLLFKGN